MFCTAPWSGLYFRPDGCVMPCCASWHVLGRVTGPDRRSLRAIWSGEEASALRDAVSEGDDGLGCWECGLAARDGHRSTSVAASFDRFDADARFPQLLDFALSNRCNLQCVMCNGGLSSAIRHHRERRPPLLPAYDDQFFDELEEFLPHARRAQFKGGEPFLAPENRRIWDSLVALDGAGPEVSVTTNGTVWTDAVARYTEALSMEVFVSIDAVDPELLRSIRVGVDPTTLWRNIDRFHEVTARTGRPLTLSFCLMKQNWHELAPFLREVDRRGVTPHVIWVDGPGDVNLLTTAPARLREIERSWAADDLEDASPQSTAIWHDALDRVRKVHDGEGLVAEVHVTEPIRARRRQGEPPEVDARRSELLGICPAGVLEITYRRDIAESVRCPPWADPLRADLWVGTGLEQIPTVISQSAGTMMRSKVESIGEGVHRLDLGLEGPEPWKLLGYHVPLDLERSDSILLLALRE